MTRSHVANLARAGGLLLVLAGCGGAEAPSPAPGEPAGGTGRQPAASAAPRTRFDNSRERLGDLAPLPETPVSGTDQDGDHIRDDIAAYVDAEYGHSELARLGARQLARGFQHGLVYADDADMAIDALQETDRAITCLHGIVDTKTAGGIVTELEARTVDTEERFAAYRKLQRRASGMYFRGGSDPRGRCSFDLRGLVP